MGAHGMHVHPSDDVTIDYYAAGEGPVIVLVHGITESRRTWDPLFSYIGQHDPHGHEFRVQEICAADELAAAGELVKGNTSRVPVAIVRGYEYDRDDDATMAPVIRESSRDLFR